MTRIPMLAVLVLITVALLALTASAAMAARPCPPGSHPGPTSATKPPVIGCVSTPNP